VKSKGVEVMASGLPILARDRPRAHPGSSPQVDS
jgi:hypothetical protein